MRRGLWLMLAALLAVACSFAPDLSRFPACDAQGGCSEGWTCLTSENRCVPDCGEQGPCVVEGPPPGSDAGDAGDAGPDADAGADAGTGEDAGLDAGTAEDAGTTPDGGGDAGTALALEPDGLAVGVEGSPYSARIGARGGTPPYTFNATGALPAGLSLATDGLLSGTPALDGDFFLPIEVLDRSTPQKRASGSLPLRVRPLLRLAGPGTLADASTGRTYAERLSATGGVPPYRFQLAEGHVLPPGLALAEDGQVTGSSEQQGPRTFSVRVTDSDTPPQEATRSLELTTVDTGLALRLMTRSVPNGRRGTAYEYTLQATGGTGSPQWSLKDGELPPGLVFDASKGLLSGTPTRADTFTFVISVSDLLAVPQQLQVSLKVD